MDLDKDLLELAKLLANPLVVTEPTPVGGVAIRPIKWEDDPKVLVLMAKLTIRLQEARAVANAAGAAHLMAADIAKRVENLEELERKRGESERKSWRGIGDFALAPTRRTVVELKGPDGFAYGFYTPWGGWEFVSKSGKALNHLGQTLASYVQRFTNYREIG